MASNAAAAEPLSSLRVAPEVLKLIPYEIMRRHQLMPLDIRNGKLCVAMARPNDPAALEDARILTGYEIEILPAAPEDLNEALRRHFSDQADHPTCPELAVESSPSSSESGHPEAHVVEAVDRLLDLGLRMRASDIHLEPQRQGFFVRFRIDGVLKTIHEFPKPAQSSICSRIKVMSGMDITERRLPQDGQAGMPHQDKVIDLRISTLPGKYGEKVVIRILDKSGLALGLERLGFDAPMQSVFESLIERPHGLIL
ncbi:MAG: Flp pilus assembly complex ATPase component TadA, partial [Elusimicrobia bacterium]|nr:Flp pilus assembly complex ATPase component TadA [Elusimicrobiota bacterium]